MFKTTWVVLLSCSVVGLCLLSFQHRDKLQNSLSSAVVNSDVSVNAHGSSRRLLQFLPTQSLSQTHSTPGRIVVNGIELEPIDVPNHQATYRMGKAPQFDGSEIPSEFQRLKEALPIVVDGIPLEPLKIKSVDQQKDTVHVGTSLSSPAKSSGQYRVVSSVAVGDNPGDFQVGGVDFAPVTLVSRDSSASAQLAQARPVSVKVGRALPAKQAQVAHLIHRRHMASQSNALPIARAVALSPAPPRPAAAAPRRVAATPQGYGHLAEYLLTQRHGADPLDTRPNVLLRSAPPVPAPAAASLPHSASLQASLRAALADCRRDAVDNCQTFMHLHGKRMAAFAAEEDRADAGLFRSFTAVNHDLNVG